MDKVTQGWTAATLFIFKAAIANDSVSAADGVAVCGEDRKSATILQQDYKPDQA